MALTEKQIEFGISSALGIGVGAFCYAFSTYILQHPDATVLGFNVQSPEVHAMGRSLVMDACVGLGCSSFTTLSGGVKGLFVSPF